MAAHPQHLPPLNDPLTSIDEPVFLTGTQALIRMLLSQRRRDREEGLNTAGFVSGYRGSPLGGVDQAMWRAGKAMEAHDIRFVPAINEDLAATMVLGTQKAGQHADREVDGVFAMWYGKGPGVDRAGDALHHGHAAGASRLGGVLLIVGDDHTAASSSIPHASEATLASWKIPVVHPASVEDYEYFGLWGWALSRFSGSWVALKAITETVESGRSFVPAPVPSFSMPVAESVQHRREYSAREFLSPAIEARMEHRLEAVRAFCRHHPLDRLIDPAPNARVGLISVGKASLDAGAALSRLQQYATPTLPPIRHLRIGLVWPLDTDRILAFAEGLDHILVVEEKGPMVEDQIKDLFYNRSRRPGIQGKRDYRGRSLIPEMGQLSPTLAMDALRAWLSQTVGTLFPDSSPSVPAAPSDVSLRRPYFCSGCPHSTSTRVPEGSAALGGVGCHYMATWMDRNTEGLTQMGGEGVDWVGLSRFLKNRHVFQNMGEGTYFHSGILAIRQAVAAGATMTYKLLFNDAVAMTGGQPVDGPLSVPSLCQQLLGEGVRHITITTDEPERYRSVALPAGIQVRHRKELDSVQRALREMEGVTVLIHDQTCAAEKRRRRKKQQMPEPARRLFINTAVCEGCGDCGVQSNCLSIVPVETPWGRKRAIDQSSCNKDYTCADGFCPSFVSVVGARPRKQRAAIAESHRLRLENLLGRLPSPDTPARDASMLIAGIGGTGVVTIANLVSMAAHLEGRSASVLDITGLAQKGGTVISHVRLAEGLAPAGPVRIDIGEADAAILCDGVAALKPEAWQTLAFARTTTILNTYVMPPSEFTQNTDAVHDIRRVVRHLEAAVGRDHLHTLNAHALAEHHQGDAILSNMIMLGHAWQRGAVPVRLESLREAIRLNGVAVDANLRAFELGRLSAWRPDALEEAIAPLVPADRHDETLEALVARHVTALTAYHDARYARRYTAAIQPLIEAERRLRPTQSDQLSITAARSLYKLMAIKDEYEVSRLLTASDFQRQLEDQFEGEWSLQYHLAPPLLARKDPHTGRPRKMRFGSWLGSVMRVLARIRRVRGTWLDVFGLQAERRSEWQVRDEFEAVLHDMAARLDGRNYGTALTLAALPLQLRGFGPVKAAALVPYRRDMARLASVFRSAAPETRVLIQAHP